MTRAALQCCVLALLVCGPAGAMELVANGDIEQPLSEGWEQTVAGAGSITRATTYDGDEDFEVMARKTTGPGYVELKQVVPLPTLDVDFAASLAMSAMATDEAWAASTLRLSFLDFHGFSLCHTNICARALRCPWNDTATEHYTEVPDADWHEYLFNLEDALVDLPGIDPEAIAAVEVSLFCLAADC